MKLSVKALAMASGILWGAVVLLVAVANMAFPSYGVAFLDVLGSVYSGYHPGTGISSIVVGSLYGAIDAAIAGAVFAWLYNLIVKNGQETQ